MTGRTPPAAALPNFAVHSVVFDDLGALGERQALKCLIIDVDRDAPCRVIPLFLDLRAHPATRYAALFCAPIPIFWNIFVMRWTAVRTILLEQIYPIPN